MVILVALRIFFLLKWILQTLGVLLSITTLLSNYDIFISTIALFFLLIPELVMGCVVWIFKDIYHIYISRDTQKHTTFSVPVFGNYILAISLYGYIAILTSAALIIGGLIGLSILCSGLTFFLCFARQEKISLILDKYLNIVISE